MRDQFVNEFNRLKLRRVSRIHQRFPLVVHCTTRHRQRQARTHHRKEDMSQAFLQPIHQLFFNEIRLGYTARHLRMMHTDVVRRALHRRACVRTDRQNTRRFVSRRHHRGRFVPQLRVTHADDPRPRRTYID